MPKPLKTIRRNRQPTVEELMSEAELQRNVIAAAKDLGYLVTFTWKSYHSPPGDCDLRMVLPREHMAGRGLMVECKSEHGKLSAPQRAFLEAWSTVQGCETYLIRPSTLEALYRVLAGQATEADKEALGVPPSPLT